MPDLLSRQRCSLFALEWPTTQTFRAANVTSAPCRQLFGETISLLRDGNHALSPKPDRVGRTTVQVRWFAAWCCGFVTAAFAIHCSLVTTRGRKATKTVLIDGSISAATAAVPTCLQVGCPSGYAARSNRDNIDCMYIDNRGNCGKEDMFTCCEAKEPVCRREWSLDFSQSSMLHNNLDGVGPTDGEPGLTLRNVFPAASGAPEKMVNVEMFAAGPYKPLFDQAQSLNGFHGSHRFAQLAASRNSTLDLQIRFVEDSTWKPVFVDPWLLTVFNIAGASLGLAGFEKFFLSHESLVNAGVSDDGLVWFSAPPIEWGQPLEDPVDPLYLTTEQRRRAVSFLIPRSSSLSLAYKVDQWPSSGKQPRLTLAGPSALTCPASSADVLRKAAKEEEGRRQDSEVSGGAPNSALSWEDLAWQLPAPTWREGRFPSPSLASTSGPPQPRGSFAPYSSVTQVPMLRGSFEVTAVERGLAYPPVESTTSSQRIQDWIETETKKQLEDLSKRVAMEQRISGNVSNAKKTRRTNASFTESGVLPRNGSRSATEYDDKSNQDSVLTEETSSSSVPSTITPASIRTTTAGPERPHAKETEINDIPLSRVSPVLPTASGIHSGSVQETAMRPETTHLEKSVPRVAAGSTTTKPTTTAPTGSDFNRYAKALKRARTQEMEENFSDPAGTPPTRPRVGTSSAETQATILAPTTAFPASSTKETPPNLNRATTSPALSELQVAGRTKTQLRDSTQKPSRDPIVTTGRKGNHDQTKVAEQMVLPATTRVYKSMVSEASIAITTLKSTTTSSLQESESEFVGHHPSSTDTVLDEEGAPDQVKPMTTPHVVHPYYPSIG